MQDDPPAKIDSKEYTLLALSPSNEDGKSDDASSLLGFSLIHLTTLCLFFHEDHICISVLAFVAFVHILAYIHSSCQSACSIEDVVPGAHFFKTVLCVCTPRIVATVWLLVSWHSVDEQRELMASFLLISIRSLRWSETFIALILRTLLFLLHNRADQVEDKDLVPIHFADRQSFRVLLSLALWAPLLAFISGYCSSIPSSMGGSLDQASSECDNEDIGDDIEDGIRSNLSSPSNALKGLKGASRFHMAVECIPNWSPPTLKQVNAWREVFSLNEELLRKYKCTLLHEKSSYQGHLFLSIGHVSFHGSRGVFLSKHLQFTVPHQSIKEVKYGEGTNLSTLCLTRPHLLKGQQVSSIELRNCLVGCQELDAVLKGLRGNRDPSRKATGASTFEAIPVAPFGPQLKFSDGDPFRNVLDTTIIGLDLECFAAELMQDEWIPEMYMLHLFERQGATEIVVMPWCLAPPELSDASRPAGKVRDLALVMPVPPAPMCPKSTKMTFTYHVVFSPALEEGVPPTILIESSAQSHDVPFGNSFLVQERTEFSPCDGGMRVNKESRVLFTRSVGFLKSKIQGSVLEGCSKAATEMKDFLQSWSRHKRNLDHAITTE